MQLFYTKINCNKNFNIQNYQHIVSIFLINSDTNLACHLVLRWTKSHCPLEIMCQGDSDGHFIQEWF